MQDQPLEVALRDIVTKNSPLPLQSLNHGDVLTKDLGFDSLAFLMTVTELEEKLKISFPLVDIDDLRNLSFGEFVRLVAEEKARCEA
jgi:acyl carrier protein